MGTPGSRALAAALIACVAWAQACSSSPPRRAAAAPSSTSAAPASVQTPVNAAPGEDAIVDAHALWTKVRVNAEKAVALGPNDPNQGWLERAIDSDGRALFQMLSRPEFEPYAAARGEIRARLLFVIKPPTPEDRREAVQSVERGFGEILKQRGRAAPAPPPAPAPPAPS